VELPRFIVSSVKGDSNVNKKKKATSTQRASETPHAGKSERVQKGAESLLRANMRGILM